MHRRLNTLLARLLIGTSIPLVLFVAVALVAAISLQRLSAALDEEGRAHEVIAATLRLDHCLNNMRLALRSPDGAGEDYDRNRRQFRELGEELRLRLGPDTRQGGKLHELLAQEQRWHEVVTAPGQTRERADDLADRLEKDVGEVLTAEEQHLEKLRQTSVAQTRECTWVIAGTAGVGFVVALLVALLAARSVSLPVRRLHQAARELIAGRFRTVPASGPTEIAQLTVHFNHVGLTLSERTTSLREQTERYQQYIGATTHLMWTTDPTGAVVADLPTWRAFTGQAEAEVLGSGWLDAVHPEERAAARAAWERAVADRSVYEGEYRLKGCHGDYRPFACRGVPVLNPDGTVREWVGTCTDVTEKKREAALQKAKEAAEASSRAKSDFLAKMSHELRTPLNAVIGMSRMLATQRFGALNAKQADYVKDIAQAGEHLLNLINDVLDLAKVEAGRMEVKAEPFDLLAEVAAVASTLRPLAEEKGLVLVLEGPAGEGGVKTDPARFRQVLYNLLSNAIKFTPSGSVTVTCQWVAGPQRDAAVLAADAAPAVRVAVRDTGIGIAPEHQSLVWQEFRQLKPSTSGGPEGTGLGLALTKRLVALLGGALWMDSEPARGSTFTFVIPRRPPDRAPEDSAQGTTGVNGDRPLALVIEDHPPTRKLLTDWLRGEGLATAWASDGEAGVELALRLRPRLIVLDVLLPKRDGWQVLADLRQSAETTAVTVVMISVSEDRAPTAGVAAQDFFVKPLDRDRFLGRLRELEPGLFPADRGPNP
jgi:PAS domain S-box-containing protein